MKISLTFLSFSSHGDVDFCFSGLFLALMVFSGLFWFL